MVHPNGERQSFSERWTELASNHQVETVVVDAFSTDCMARIADCDAFMWRYPSSACPRVFAQRLLFAVEQGLRIPVFPSARSSWFYEDKLAQSHFFEAAGISHVFTHIARSRQAAERYCDNAQYPFVLKLAGGHQSANVQLVRTRKEARFYVDELFGHGVVSLGYRAASRPRRALRQLRAAAQVAKGRNPYASTESELAYGYFYAQEFLAGNEFEVSVIVIGNRAFACRRFVAPGDFRTCGSSSRIDFTPTTIDEDAVRLAYRVAHELGAQTVGVDILRRGSDPVVVELTVNYASWVVRTCPGHWILEGDPDSGKLHWTDGTTRAADAVFEDFLIELSNARPLSMERTETAAPTLR